MLRFLIWRTLRPLAAAINGIRQGSHSPIPFQSAQCYHAQELEETNRSSFVIRNKAGIVKTYTVHLLLLYLIQAL